jgi:hypothetical protein
MEPARVTAALDAQTVWSAPALVTGLVFTVTVVLTLRGVLHVERDV